MFARFFAHPSLKELETPGRMGVLGLVWLLHCATCNGKRKGKLFRAYPAEDIYEVRFQRII